MIDLTKRHLKRKLNLFISRDDELVKEGLIF